MYTRSLMRAAAVMIVAGVLAGRVTAAPPTGRVVDLTGNDQMKYNVNAIAAKPGELLHVRLKNIGTLPKQVMSHNFILLAKGTDVAAFTTAGATAVATGYIDPKFKAKVLTSTPLAGPGETVEVTFKAPAAPGQYTYLCSFPGHFLSGMKGVLTVK
jgi:azurin